MRRSTVVILALGVAFTLICLLTSSFFAADKEDEKPYGITRIEAFIRKGRQTTFKTIVEPAIINTPNDGGATLLVYALVYKFGKEPVAVISLGADTQASLAPEEIDLEEKSYTVKKPREVKGLMTRTIPAADAVLRLKSGYAMVTKELPRSRPVIRVKTPAIFMTVIKSTDLFLAHQESETRLGILKGSVVHVGSSRKAPALGKGKMLTAGPGKQRRVEPISDDFLSKFSQFRYRPTGVQWLVDDAEASERVAMYYPENCVQYVENEQNNVIELNLAKNAWQYGKNCFYLQFGNSTPCHRIVGEGSLDPRVAGSQWIGDLSTYKYVAFKARCDTRPAAYYLVLYGFGLNHYIRYPFKVGKRWQYIILDLTKTAPVADKRAKKRYSNQELRKAFVDMRRITKIETVAFLSVSKAKESIPTLYIDDFSFHRDRPKKLPGK